MAAKHLDLDLDLDMDMDLEALLLEHINNHKC